MSKIATARRQELLQYLKVQAEPALIMDIAKHCKQSLDQVRADVRCLALKGLVKQKQHRGLVPGFMNRLHTATYLSVAITDEGRKLLSIEERINNYQ